MVELEEEWFCDPDSPNDSASALIGCKKISPKSACMARGSWEGGWSGCWSLSCYEDAAVQRKWMFKT